MEIEKTNWILEWQGCKQRRVLKIPPLIHINYTTKPIALFINQEQTKQVNVRTFVAFHFLQATITVFQWHNGIRQSEDWRITVHLRIHWLDYGQMDELRNKIIMKTVTWWTTRIRLKNKFLSLLIDQLARFRYYCRNSDHPQQFSGVPFITQATMRY